MIRAKPRTRKLLQEVLAEVVRVGRVLGIEIPEDLATQQMAFIDTLPHAMTSMLNGLEERPSPRTAWLSDSVVEMGRGAGMATPHNEILGALLAPYEYGQG